jgi:hypothetical protein
MIPRHSPPVWPYAKPSLALTPETARKNYKAVGFDVRLVPTFHANRLSRARAMLIMLDRSGALPLFTSPRRSQ